MKKLCKYCDQEKPLKQFVKDNKCRGGYRHMCLLCKAQRQKKSDNLRRYGVSDAQLQQLYSETNGKCMLCGKKPTGNKSILEIDHDHTTGAVRGLLCHYCNLFVYAVNQSPMRARALAKQLPAYLERIPIGALV
jgi:hypothetical protein